MKGRSPKFPIASFLGGTGSVETRSNDRPWSCETATPGAIRARVARGAPSRPARGSEAEAAVAADPGLVDVPAVDGLHDLGVPPAGAMTHLDRLCVPGRVRRGHEWQEKHYGQRGSQRETGSH